MKLSENFKKLSTFSSNYGLILIKSIFYEYENL